jgi:hypothetical protein
LTPRHPAALTVQRLALRSSRVWLARGLWVLVFRAMARAAGRCLTWHEQGASTYVRGGAAEDFLPGLSDIDLAVVLPDEAAAPGAARDRASRRWERLRRIPGTEVVLDLPRIYEYAELRDIAGASVLTYGLAGREQSASDTRDAGSPRSLDATRMLGRPGLYGATADWRLLTGRDLRPHEPARDAQSRRIAAWLELVHWWRLVFPTCVDSRGPRAADLGVKIVAEPARIWLWLAHGERASGRTEALRLALRRLPEEEEALRRTLALRRALPDASQGVLGDALPTSLRLTARIAELIAREVADEGTTEVRLIGDAEELILPDGEWRRTASLADGDVPDLLPLGDWRALALPLHPDESFAPLPDDPRDPEVLGIAAVTQPAGPYPALSADGLLIFPGTPLLRSRLRSIQCPVSDPVSFALVEGRRAALFPRVLGWSAEDSARRAVAEHRARLSVACKEGRGRTLGRLFTSARAALFLETIRGGDPELPLTMVETARRLSERSSSARAVAEEAVDRYRAFALDRAEPPEGTVSAMRRLMLSMPSYAGAQEDAGDPAPAG